VEAWAESNPPGKQQALACPELGLQRPEKGYPAGKAELSGK